MAEYCSEDDLILIRPGILDLGVLDWSAQIVEMGKILDRAIEVQWYRNVADDNAVDWRTTLFDRELLSNAEEQLTRVACYKTLELIFMFLMKHRANDAFATERELFAKLYKEELREVMIAGLDYDWDDDGLGTDEISVLRVRRLVRV